ncbi:MAG: transposase [Rubrobacteraceae bacterium]|nr:transposase [Rubrobacteraceae bacterium]
MTFLVYPTNWGQGRPRRDDRQVLCAILWVMDTGATWRELPDEVVRS